jgi:FkbM family methyltransferase
MIAMSRDPDGPRGDVVEARTPPTWARAARAGVAAVLRMMADAGTKPSHAAANVVRRLPAGLWLASEPVVARRRGITFELDLRDNVQRTLYFIGWYERGYLSLLTKELRRGDVVVDVGGHVGIFALVLAKRLKKLGGGRVIVFEPAPDVAAKLRAAVERNRLTNVQVVETALGAGKGTAELKTDPGRFHESDGSVRSLYGPGDVAYVVPVTRFDDWAQSAGLTKMDVVKMDVEGAELGVLRGMSDSLRRLRPRLVGLEIQDYLVEQAGVAREDIFEFIHAHGYAPTEPYDVEGNYLFRRVGG